MWDVLSIWLTWAGLIVGLAPIFIGVGWEIVEGTILPALVRREEIERLADEEHAAWFRTHSYEEGKWRRVRKLIRRRLAVGETPPG